MPSVISPSVPPNVSGQPATQAGPRGRFADEPEGRSFGAVLNRSRAAGAGKMQDGADALPVDAAAQKKPSRAEDKKDELPADLVAMALLAPAPVPASPTPTALPAGVQNDGMAAVPATPLTPEIAQGALPADALATTTPVPDADAAPQARVAAQGTAAEAAVLSAQAPMRADGLAPAQLPDASPAEAAVPPLAASVPLPSAASAAPGAGVVPADEKQATAVPSLQPAEDLKTAPIASATSADRLDPASAMTSPASPPILMSASAASQATQQPEAPAGRAPVLTVAPLVGSEAWGPAIGHQMLRMNAGGHHVAELNLNPIGLGPLKVTLTLGDNQAQAMFVSAHESVRKAVEAAVPQLRTILAEQGISLGQTSVGAESHPSFRQGGSFAQQQQPAPSWRPDYPGSGRGDAAAVATPSSSPPPGALRRLNAGVDTFA